jgi:hypothetical protein
LEVVTILYELTRCGFDWIQILDYTSQKLLTDYAWPFVVYDGL